MTPHALTLLQAYWPLLLPVALLQWTLAIVALIHVLRPILYFTVGKAEQPWTRS